MTDKVSTKLCSAKRGTGEWKGVEVITPERGRSRNGGRRRVAVAVAGRVGRRWEIAGRGALAVARTLRGDGGTGGVEAAVGLPVDDTPSGGSGLKSKILTLCARLVLQWPKFLQGGSWERRWSLCRGRGGCYRCWCCHLLSMATRSSPFKVPVARASNGTRADRGALCSHLHGGADRAAKFGVVCVFSGIVVISAFLASSALSRLLDVEVLMLRCRRAAETASGRWGGEGPRRQRGDENTQRRRPGSEDGG